MRSDKGKARATFEERAFEKKRQIVIKARGIECLYWDEIEKKYGINPSEACELFWYVKPYERI